MAQAKASSKKSKDQQKRGIDFKKIKRKIGRKLPPPKNSTNTNIKSKAIILPEQSVASERSGLAVSKKGLTLKELLQQTSHYNTKVRRDALIGIKDLFVSYPEELKLHKYAVIEKLRERISDEDKLVREMLYQLFKLVVFPSCKEDNFGPFIPLMMSCIFNAMTHLAIDVRLMALKFVVLVVQNYPPSFSSYAEKILLNYENILQNSQLYLQDKSKFSNILSGLLHCLALLPLMKGENICPHSLLHALEFDAPNDSGLSSAIIMHIESLMLVLLNYFHEFVTLVSSKLDVQSFDCMLYILQSVDLAVGFCHHGVGSCQPVEVTAMPGKTLSPMLFKKIWDVFPLDPTHHFSEKGGDRYFILNLVMAKILLQSCDLNSLPVVLLEKVILFMECALVDQTTVVSSKNARHEKYFHSLLSFFPKLISQSESCWKYRLLQAFTNTFKDCSPGSSLKLTCLSIIEEMLLHQGGILFLDVNDPDTSTHMVAWIRELPLLLIQLGDTHLSFSKAVLLLILRLGQCTPLNSSMALEYDHLQYSLLEFYSSCLSEGTMVYGPFIKLPDDSQKLSICGLYYFSFLDPLFLKSLVFCCLCHDLKPVILLQLVDVLHSSYKAGRIQIGDHLSFFITLLSCFKVIPEHIFPVENSNRTAYRSVTSLICSCLSEMGDHFLISQIMENAIFERIESGKLPLDNICALLRVLVVLDSRFTVISEQTIIDFLPAYLMDVALSIPDSEDECSGAMCIRARRYYLTPCFFLLGRSRRVLSGVVVKMGIEVGSFVPSADDTSRVIATLSVLIRIFKDSKLQKLLGSSNKEIDRVLHDLLVLQCLEAKDLTFEGRNKIKCAYDRLVIVTSTLIPSK